MPVLEIPQLHLPEAGVYLEAVMLWPRAGRDQHLRVVEAARNQAVQNVLRRNAGAAIQPDAINLLAAAAAGPRLAEVCINPEAVISPQFRLIRRDVAVRLFLFVVSCIEAGDPADPPTLEHARKVLSTAGGAYSSYPGLGRSELIDIWNDHMPAAHLLAAKALIGSRWDSRAENASGRLLAEFLAYAELFRRRGEQHRPARSRFSLLDPADTWKVPDWVDLPPIPDGCPGLPSPGRIKAELATGWLHPREVRGSVDMSM